MSMNDWLGESTKSSHCCQIIGIIFCLQQGGIFCPMFLRNMVQMLYNRYKRCGVFERIFEARACENADLSTLMIDASLVKVHRISQRGQKRRPRGEPEVAWLHLVCDGRPVSLSVTTGLIFLRLGNVLSLP